MISLLIAVLILGVIAWIITILPVPQPFKTIAFVVLGLILIIWLLQMMPSGPHFFYRGM